MLAPFCFDYLAGSILRWDWLFALGIAMAFWLQRSRSPPARSSATRSLSKLFPIFVRGRSASRLAVDSVRAARLDPGARPPRRRRRRRGDRVRRSRRRRCSAGRGSGRDYRERIGVTQHEKFYANQYSLQTVYLQIGRDHAGELAARPLEARRRSSRHAPDVDGRRPTGLARRPARPDGARARRARERAGSLEALAVGPFLVFVWLTVNAYYWNMLGLTALALAARQFARGDRLSAGLLALHVVWGAYYLYQHLNAGYAEGYFVAVLLLATLVIWAAQALISPARPDDA